MCVIVHKPSGVDIPAEVVKACFAVNSDGAGLAYWTRRGIKVIKGLMAVNDALEAIDQHMDKSLVIHFRLKTHGIRNAHQTHPFALEDKTGDAKAYDPQKIWRAVLFHNGILSNFGDSTKSDTLDFCQNVLAKVKSCEARRKILKEVGSKFALLQDGSVWLIGDFTKYEGMSFSNMYWKHRMNTPAIATSVGGFHSSIYFFRNGKKCSRHSVYEHQLGGWGKWDDGEFILDENPKPSRLGYGGDDLDWEGCCGDASPPVNLGGVHDPNKIEEDKKKEETTQSQCSLKLLEGDNSATDEKLLAHYEKQSTDDLIKTADDGRDICHDCNYPTCCSKLGCYQERVFKTSTRAEEDLNDLVNLKLGENSVN